MATTMQRLQMFDSDDPDSYLHGVKHHFWQHTANQRFDNFGTDTPESYNPDSGYDREGFSYIFNSAGYRCDPLQKSPLLSIGCSYTFGTGLPVVDTWSYLIAHELGIPHINLGYQGGSFSYFQRTLLKTLDVIQPDYVALLFPYNWRFELFGPPLKVWTASGVHAGLFEGKERDRMYAYEQFRTQEQEEFEIIRNLAVIARMVRPAKLLHSHWSYGDNRPSMGFRTLTYDIGKYIPFTGFDRHQRHMELDTKARDGIHPGYLPHRLFAERVIPCLRVSPDSGTKTD